MLAVVKRSEAQYFLRKIMRAIEFIIEQQQGLGLYTIGDSTAYNLGKAGPWQSFGQPGSNSSSFIHKSGLDQIPAGSVVAIALGADDATGTSDSPEQIAGRISSLIDQATTKKLKFVFVLFPANISQDIERNQQIRSAIESAISNKAPILDMQSASGQAAGYPAISAQILTQFGSSIAVKAPKPSAPSTPSKSLGALNFEPGVDNRINPILADKLTKIFADFGKNLPIHSGYRDPARNRRAGGAKNSAHMRHNAVDISTGNLSKADRLKLIRIASSYGIGGIGVYANNLHFDIENKRAWGPDYHSTSIPGWAKSTIMAHLSGQPGSQIA